MSSPPLLRRTFAFDLGTAHLSAALLDPSEEHFLLARTEHGRTHYPAEIPSQDGTSTPLLRCLEQPEPVPVGRELLTPVQFLGRLLLAAREGLGRVIPNQPQHLLDRAVLALPANQLSNQQEHFLTAARQAGIVLQFTAQASASAEYHAWLGAIGAGTWLVVDVGARWRTSLVQGEPGSFAVLLECEEPNSGGMVFDQLLAEQLFPQRLNLAPEERTTFQPRLRRIARALKEALSTCEEATRFAPEFWPSGSGPASSLEISIKGSQIGDFLHPSVTRGLASVRELLQQAQDQNLLTETIDGVVLTGASCQLPWLREQLQAELAGLGRHSGPVCHDPEWAVLRGAALSAARDGCTYLFGGEPPTIPAVELKLTTGLDIPLRSPGATASQSRHLQGQVASSALPDLTRGGSVRLLDMTTGLGEECYLDSGGHFSHRVEAGAGGTRSLRLLVAGADSTVLATLPLELRPPERPGPLRLDTACLPEAIHLELLDRQRRRHRHPLAQAGASLPGNFICRVKTSDQSGRLVLPFYQERRRLREIMLSDVDPGLPVGSPLEIRLQLSADRTGVVEVKVAATGWRERETLNLLPPLAIPARVEVEGLVAALAPLLPSGAESRSRGYFEERWRTLREALRDCVDDVALEAWLSLQELLEHLQHLQGQPLHPPLARFRQLVKHCLFLAGDVARGTGRARAELFEQVYAQERFGEQACQEHNQVQYRECVVNLLQFGRYLDQLQRDELGCRQASEQQEDLERELLADPGVTGMLEGPV